MADSYEIGRKLILESKNSKFEDLELVDRMDKLIQASGNAYGMEAKKICDGMRDAYIEKWEPIKRCTQ